MATKSTTSSRQNSQPRPVNRSIANQILNSANVVEAAPPGAVAVATQRIANVLDVANGVAADLDGNLTRLGGSSPIDSSSPVPSGKVGTALSQLEELHRLIGSLESVVSVIAGHVQRFRSL